MPRYAKAKNKKLVRKMKRFKHPYQIIHFLQTASDSQFKPFQELASDYVTGKQTPPTRLKRRALQKIATKGPKALVKDTVRSFQENDALGGGIVVA